MRGLANRSEGLANRSQGLGGRADPVPVDINLKSEGLGAGPARALSIKVRGWAGWAGPGPVDKSEGLGAGLAQALSIKVRGEGLVRREPPTGSEDKPTIQLLCRRK